VQALASRSARGAGVGVRRHGQVRPSKVHADLVRAARLEPYVEKRVTGQELPHSKCVIACVSCGCRASDVVGRDDPPAGASIARRVERGFPTTRAG